jgi:hypothetical protein
VNLSKRGKWLIGIAALIGAYVAFGPAATESVEPAKAAGRSVSHLQPAASLTVPVARSLLALAHRVAEQTSADALFASHSWYVAPPPPPPPVVDTTPQPPPTPVAPPLPFTYMGSYAPNGAKPVYFLTQGDRVYDVHIGDTLDNTYTVDAVSNGALVFTYKPLNQQQQLNIGGAQ